MKVRPVGVDLFHADGQTDMTKLFVAFRNFANEPKNLRSPGTWNHVGWLINTDASEEPT